jgi:hypothetical protein
MQLIGRYDSPCVRRVGVSLRVLELPFDHLPLAPFSQAGELRTFAAIGGMPVWVLDSGETLIDSAAIRSSGRTRWTGTSASATLGLATPNELENSRLCHGLR